MARKSSVSQLPPEQRGFLEKLLRDDCHTLDEIIDQLREKFPKDVSPSRSALGRYKQSFDEIVRRQRGIQEASRALVAELGEDVDDRAGALLSQAVTTLVANVALTANDPDAEEMSVKEVSELARAARAVMQARTMSMKERQEIERMARDRLLREQKEKLDELGRSGEVPQDMLNKVIAAAYGL